MTKFVGLRTKTYKYLIDDDFFLSNWYDRNIYIWNEQRPSKWKRRG